MNLQKMMKQAQQMQANVAEVQASIEAREFESSAGGGMVKVRINGKNRPVSFQIDESLLKAEEKEMLEDLLVAAFNEARDQVDKTQEEEMGKLTGGMGLPPGMKLPF